MDMGSRMMAHSDRLMCSPGNLFRGASSQKGNPVHEWRMEEGGSLSLGLSVFGLRGDRFSIIVIPADTFPEQKPGSDVEWSLIHSSKESGDERVLFVLQWTMEMRGSGCLALCGREMPVFPVRPS
jgi:hypothetical protein